MRPPAALAFADCWLRMQDFVPGAKLRLEGAAVVGVTGLLAPTLNGVWATAPIDAGDAMALLDEVAMAGVPYCIMFPREGAAALAAAVGERGMARDDDIPLMELTRLAIPRVPAGLSFRVLRPDQAQLHAEVAAEGFGAPVELFAQLVTATFVSAEDTVVLVGELDGEAVCTGVAIARGSCVGVFNIATPPRYRGRGYGAALTAKLVADAFEQGAERAWLQSSPSGYRVYERLGFRTVDTWQTWIAA